MIKPLFPALSLPFLLTTPAFAEPSIYMGKAATGESVYYHGATAQCGDLPRHHTCWKNPMVSYRIGRDHVAAITNCQKGVFSEVWLDGKLVRRNMKPESEAMRLVLRTACNSVR